MRRIRIVPIVLIAINVGFFLLEMSNENIINMGAVNAASVFQSGQWYRLITSMFLHGGIEHLAFNMLSLYIMSDWMLHFVKTGKYLTIYMGSGLLGGLMSIGATQLFGFADVWSVGASGAIMGLLGANIILL